MKKNKTISKLVATAAMAVVAIAPSFAQTNLGAACGCPPVGSRPTVLLSSLTTDISTPSNNNAGVLTAANTILTCANTYILDKKIYVDSLKSLTIQAGALIKGKKYSTADSATLLIVQRGAKVFAIGTESCPIVFTGINDPMDGTYGISHRGDWGGIALLGKAYNNLTLALNGPAGAGKQCVSDGVGYIEGFSFANGRNHHGAGASFDNNDNSGIMQYVSIRHSGAIIATGNEIQGLSLGSVGRGTTIDHIDIISSDDDGIELFGGTVDLKYITALFGSDDMFDWDNAWSGRAQFLFGIAPSDTTVATGITTADNGFESDSWDNGNTTGSLSIPVIYNSTLIGNYSTNLASDNSGHAAFMAKDGTGGEIYNSVFSNWAYGFDTKTISGNKPTYTNWNTDFTLKVNCNTFSSIRRPAMGNVPMSHNRVVTGIIAADTVKFNLDGNKHPLTIAGLDPSYAMNFSTNVVSDKYDAIPNPAISTTCTAPSDGFFTPAPYQGAFASTGKSWLSNWAYAAILSVTPGLVPCATDINADGTTNNVDFLQLLGSFNDACQ